MENHDEKDHKKPTDAVENKEEKKPTILSEESVQEIIDKKIKELFKKEHSDVDQLRSILLEKAPSALEANYSNFASELKNYHILLEDEREKNKQFQEKIENTN